MAVAALVFLGFSCARRIEAPPMAEPVGDGLSVGAVSNVYILTLDVGVCRDSVIAEAGKIGVDILYNYVNFNMMAIRIPDTTTIERVLRAMPSFRGGFMSDQIMELHNDKK